MQLTLTCFWHGFPLNTSPRCCEGPLKCHNSPGSPQFTYNSSTCIISVNLYHIFMTKTSTTLKTALKQMNALADQLIFANEYLNIIFKFAKLLLSANLNENLSFQPRLGKSSQTQPKTAWKQHSFQKPNQNATRRKNMTSIRMITLGNTFGRRKHDRAETSN